MQWLRQNPFFYTILGLLVVTVLAGVWESSRLQLRLEELKGEYETRDKQLSLYLARSPLPTSGNLRALQSNYKELYQIYAQLQGSLNLSTYDAGLFFGKRPATSTDAYFEIAQYVEESRNLASGNKINFDPASRFGFSKYVNVGPAEEDIELVNKQTRIMSFILQSLFDSGISEFVSIQRESPSRESGQATGRPGSANTIGDIFEIDPMASVSIDGLIEDHSFRVAFRSQSVGLRNFVNRLVNSSLPFVVCGIEASSADSSETESSRMAMAENPFMNPESEDRLIEAARVPIISENESLFYVTLAFLENTRAFDPPVLAEIVEEVPNA